MSGKRKSKLAGRLKMWEQASNTGIDSVPKKPGSPKKNRKRASVSGKKSKLANMWEDKAKDSKVTGIKDSKDKPPVKHSYVSKISTPKTTTTTTTTTSTTKAKVTPKVTPKPKTTPTPSTESKQNETPKKKVKKVNKFAGRAGKINLAGLRGGPPPSLAKKKKAAADKPKEMINEEFPRVTMTMDRKSRTRPEADTVLNSHEKKTESDTEMTNNDISKDENDDNSENNENNSNTSENNDVINDNNDDTMVPSTIINNSNSNTNMETLVSKLNNFMKNEFIFDEHMLMPSKYLLLYLKETGKIDFGTISSAVSPTPTNEDDTSTIASLSLAHVNDRLKECIFNLFGSDSVKPFGFAIRLLNKIEKIDKKMEMDSNDDDDDSDDSNVQNDSDTETKQKKLYETV